MIMSELNISLIIFFNLERLRKLTLKLILQSEESDVADV